MAAAPPPPGPPSVDIYRKEVRSSAPSRKKAAGSLKSDSVIPEDAIPDVHIPGFIESLLGGPVVHRQKYLKPDGMVRNLQLLSYIVLGGLGILTYIVNPPDGTVWRTLAPSSGLATLLHTLVIFGAILIGGIGIMRRAPQYLLVSYALFIFASLRFTSSDITLAVLSDEDIFQSERVKEMLVIGYAVSLVLFFELSNGVLRFSMLDTSIRTNEVYVMNIKRVVSKYRRSLILNPVIAATFAWFALTMNEIIPAIVSLFSDDAGERLRESVELGSVYGVALGTVMVFLVIGGVFALDVPGRLATMRDRNN